MSKLTSNQAVIAADRLLILKNFVSTEQVSAISEGLRGEEGEYFLGIIAKLTNTFTEMPEIYGQDGKGEQAIAYLHYFRGGMDWYVTEKDMAAKQHQAFGLANLGYGGSMGYISIEELMENQVEIDFHFEPKTIAECR